jgi:hypothetical protein
MYMERAGRSCPFFVFSFFHISTLIGQRGNEMIVNVRLLEYGEAGEIRKVDVPDEFFNRAKTIDVKLDLVFHYGQNDSIPLRQYSVSVGDVIEMDNDLYMVEPIGFKKITEEEFARM